MVRVGIEAGMVQARRVGPVVVGGGGGGGGGRALPL